MTKYFLAVVLLAGVVYGLILAWPLIRGPSLVIEAPEADTSYPGGIVTVRGKAHRVAELTLNGAPLLHEADGDFSTVLTFPPGGSILTFIAVDRFGRRVTLTRSIFVP